MHGVGLVTSNVENDGSILDHEVLSYCASCIKSGAFPVQMSMAEYREKLYMEIVKRKKELRRKQKEREHGRSRSRSHYRSSAAAADPYAAGANGGYHGRY